MYVVYVYMYKHVGLGESGGMLPYRKFLEIRCSEIASEDRHFGTNYIGHRVLHPVYGCTYIHFLSLLTSNSHERRYSRWGTDGDVY